MDREISTHVKFNENCEYLPSEIYKVVSIPRQIVNIDLSVSNLEAKTEENENTYYYDDRIQLTAKVYQPYIDDEGKTQKHYIKTGRIEFYFQPEGSTTFSLINESTVLNTTCEVNANGSAAVIFKPKSSGIVYAKYIDETDFYTAVTDINPEGISTKQDIILNEIPVKIQFEHVPPFLTSVHDEVTLKVHVTNGITGDNIQYGTVTFLHYLTKSDVDTPEKRIPKTIGNPVPVINGYAEINYIPVQTDDEIEPEILEENGESRYVEYIRASYNYTGKYIDTEKGAYKWKYYDTASVWTGINVLARNSITLSTPLQMSETPNIYQCSETDTITLIAALKDKDDNMINFNNHRGDLIFHIEGTHAHPKKEHIESENIPQIDDETSANFNKEQLNSEFEFIEYTNGNNGDIVATFTGDLEEGQFTAQIGNLLPGFYTITARTTEDSLQMDKATGNPLIQDTQNGDVENNKIYAPVESSNTIYIMSNYREVNNYNITLQHDSGFTYLNSRVNNLKCVVTGLSNTEMNILNGKTCKFYIRELNETYIGSLSYSGGKLYGTPSEDIIFNIADNYSIYAYIPSGIYTNDYTIKTYEEHNNDYDFYLSTIISSPLIMQTRENVELSLKIDSTSNIRPATLLYTLTGKKIVDSINVQIIAKSLSGEKIVDNVTLYKQSTKAVNNITIEEAGNYQIYAKAGTITSDKVNITIEKDSLSHELLESSKKIFASKDNTMGIYLYSTNNTSLIDKNKLHFYVYDKDENNKREVTIQAIKGIDINTKYVTIRPNISTEDEWYLQVTYEGDSIFNKYEGTLDKFQTGLSTPTIKLIPSNENYGVQILNEYSKNEIIVLKVKFINKNNLVKEGILITDTTGYGKFYDREEDVETSQWWRAWDNIVFIFDAYDNELVHILGTNQIPYDALKNKYEYVFDYKNITDNEYLRNQLADNNDEYIYGGYKVCDIRISRLNAL